MRGVYSTGMSGATIAKQENEVKRESAKGEFRRYWDFEQDKRLVKLLCASNGASRTMVAEIMGWSTAAIWTRTAILSKANLITRVKGRRNVFIAVDDLEDRLQKFHDGRRCRGTGNVWTTEDDDKICELEMQGLNNHQIAEQTGRTWQAIQQRLVKLRQEGEIAPACKQWTEDEDKELQDYFYGGFDDANIARKLGRTAGSVIKRRGVLKLRRNARGLPTWN